MPVRPMVVLLVSAVLLAGCSEPSSDAPDVTRTPVATTSTSAAPATTANDTGTDNTGTSTTTLLPSQSSPATSSPGPDPTSLYSNFVRTERFTDALDLDIHAPAEIGPWPVIVVIHGGGWITGQRSDTGSLADGLASRNAVVFNADYRTLSLGGIFPGMVDDVACAIQFARTAAAEFSTTPEVVTVVGYSAGAHLASLAAFAPGAFGQDCASGPSQPPDVFVGLAGPYDISQFGGLLAPMFGGTITEIPEVWAAGNPLSWLIDSPDIPTLLIHGDADRVAPLAFSEELATALTAAGRSVSLEVLPGRSHADVSAPRVVADRILEFLAAVSG